MKFSTLASGALGAGLAMAAPTGLEKKQDTNIDLIVLQFALTLEHLENAFYKLALTKFSQQDFINAGYSATYYNNIKYISFDEQTHVQTLSAAISAAGATPVAACSYNFGFTDVPSFITVSSVLEGVGTSAYLGGAPLITSKDYLTAAGSILVTEAIHTSYQRAAKGEVPMANPYGTPLDPTAVFTLASAFITSCPDTNAALPFVPFPGLMYNAPAACTCEEPDCTPSAAIKTRNYHSKWSDWYGHHGWGSGMTKPPPAACSPPMAGATAKFTAPSAIPAGSYLTFISGLSVVSVKGNINGMEISACIPAVAQGQTYVLVTKSDVEGKLDDTAVLFGPAIIEVAPAAPAIDFGQI